MDLDEIDLAILDLIEITDDAGISRGQAARMLHERIEIAFAIVDALASWGWPEPTSTALH
jgi:hypothetical protein